MFIFFDLLLLIFSFLLLSYCTILPTLPFCSLLLIFFKTMVCIFIPPAVIVKFLLSLSMIYKLSFSIFFLHFQPTHSSSCSLLLVDLSNVSVYESQGSCIVPRPQSFKNYFLQFGTCLLRGNC